MYPIRICGLCILCLFFMTAMAQAAQRPDGSFAGSGAPQPLQQGAGSSALPSESAQQGRLPSGQGSGGPVYTNYPTSMTQQGMAPEPLYIRGNRFNDSRPFTGMPAWAQQGRAPGSSIYPPFGANLFQGYFAGTYAEGMNENYIIMPGDRIQVNIWGAHAYNDTLMVDQQGNIFLPEVGPVPVAGMRHGSLQSQVRQYLASTFKTNVEIYANLLTAQPVAVYVTGFVTRPGRYAGGMTDSVLYYLDRAGGIIPDRGTYRDIKVQRNGKTVASVDLYAFILKGAISSAQLRDGDVILVGPRGNCVLADGLIPQHASYESRGQNFSGADLTAYASPLPATSHVSIVGTRSAVPFHVYMSLQEFSKFPLSADDRVEFLADKPGESIMVSVSGSILGATRYPVKRNTSLHDVLAHVPIDPKLSNLSGIYIKRRSVVEQQRKAIADSLRRLETSVLTATSANQESAAIRVQEAQLVQNFASRVSTLQPDGVVVVTQNGATSNILLEDGDEIVIPQRSNIVQISGEVMVPKAVVYNKDYAVKRYVQDAGGFTDRADDDNILVVHPNGQIGQASDTDIQAGDMLLVMPRYDSKGFSIFKDIIQVLYQIAIATRAVVTL